MFLSKRADLSKSPSRTCAIALLTVLVGCGGGGGTSAPADNSGAPEVGRFVPNYALETDPQTNQPNRLLHWSNLPVRVHFVQNQHLTDNRKSLASSGFAWWTSAFGGEMEFEVVDDPAKADIRISFVEDGMTATGATQYSYVDSSELVTADIALNLTLLSNPAFIPATAAHEFGHALGIGGHSSDRVDLMASAPNLLGLFRPTLRDENTMKTAYIPVMEGRSSTAKGIRTGSISCKLH